MRLAIPIFLAFFILISMFFTGMVSVDLWMHRWLYGASSSWHWIDYFTSRHAIAMLYIKYGWEGLMAPTAILALLCSWGILRER